MNLVVGKLVRLRDDLDFPEYLRGKSVKIHDITEVNDTDGVETTVVDIKHKGTHYGFFTEEFYEPFNYYFKAGDKVKCVHNIYNNPLLTIGDEYTVIGTEMFDYEPVYAIQKADGTVLHCIGELFDKVDEPKIDCESNFDETDIFDEIELVENDAVNPNHYKSQEVECIEAIKCAVSGKKGIEAVCVANVIKYLWRYEMKNELEDVKKAQWYLIRLVS